MTQKEGFSRRKLMALFGATAIGGTASLNSPVNATDKEDLIPRLLVDMKLRINDGKNKVEHPGIYAQFLYPDGNDRWELMFPVDEYISAATTIFQAGEIRKDWQENLPKSR